MKRSSIRMAAAAILILAVAAPMSQSRATITEIIDSTGDGEENQLSGVAGVAVDTAGNVYVVAQSTGNAFKIAPSGAITEIIDSSGDGEGHGLNGPLGVAVDVAGNVYVTGGVSNNAFKIEAPGNCSTGGTPCTITEIIDSSGDGGGFPGLVGAWEVAVDAAGNVFVAGQLFSNVFKIKTPGNCSTGGTPCTITQIIDGAGDGVNGLSDVGGMAVDVAGNVYVSGQLSQNAYKIQAPGDCSTGGMPCMITQIIDSSGDGEGNGLVSPWGMTVDATGNVYVGDLESDKVFKIEPDDISVIIDSSGDGGGNQLEQPNRLAVDAAGNVYVTGTRSDNAFKIAPDDNVTVIIDSSGDGEGNELGFPWGVAVDAEAKVYVSGSGGSVFKIECADADGDGFGFSGHSQCSSGTVEDCDDTDPCIYPGAPEVFDGKDNNCDGDVDEGLDDDGDGIPNFNDLCPDSPLESGVDPTGCALCAGAVGDTLTMHKAAGGEITLTWDHSCVVGNDYAVYGGTLGDFTSHSPADSPGCTTGGATTATFTPELENRYYLVVPQAQVSEGSYGTDSLAMPRLQSASACHEEQTMACGE